MGQRPLLIRLTGLTGVLCISFAAIFVREAAVDATTITVFRALYALPLLGLAWVVVRQRDGRDRRARALAFASGLILAIDLTAFHHAIEAIGAGLGTVLANTQVMFVGVAAWLVWRERPSRVALWGVPAVLIGVALLSGLGQDDAYGDDPVTGVLYGLVAGVAYAGFLLVFRASNRRHFAPTPGPLLDATLGTAVGGLVLGLFAADFSLVPEWPAHGWLIAMGALVQTLGWLFIAFALPRLPALDTSVLLLVQPVAAILWARLIFAETLSPLQGIGVLVVLAGVLVVSLKGSVQPASVPLPRPVTADP